MTLLSKGIVNYKKHKAMLNINHFCNKLLTAVIISASSLCISAQNPYLPLWEHIPDGEPYVFEDPDRPGEYRVYVYGSHDSLLTEFCGREQVVWSAPVTDLNAWRYDGVIFISDKNRDGKPLYENEKGDILYAPDVAVVSDSCGVKTYYLYPNNQAEGRQGMVAKSKRPDGPFEVCNWSLSDPNLTDGVLRFDPAVFVDDDGKVYGYWGFGDVYGAELDPTTMATLKPGGPVVKNMVSALNQEGVFKFFEASSMRKIKDKYVFVYSRLTDEGEFGLPSNNYTLAYAYSNNPLGPFTYGGTIIDGRARGVNEKGEVIHTAYPSGNTHGSICEINGQWWVFYHRQSGTTEYSRQAMVAPIELIVEEGIDGKVYISEGEITSEGFSTDGLNPLFKTPAGIACYLVGPEGSYEVYPNYVHSGSYIKAEYFDPETAKGPFNQKIPYSPVVNNTSGSTIGYKYIDFSKIDCNCPVEFKCSLLPAGIDGTVTLLIGSPYKSKGGKEIGKFQVSADMPARLTEISTKLHDVSDVEGKQPLYLLFDSGVKGTSICDLYDFQFANIH